MHSLGRGETVGSNPTRGTINIAMHQIGKDIAWILPPRTGTKTTLVALYNDRYIVQKFLDDHRRWHYVIPENLEDRKLYMNVRNPYTRMQSNWRYYYGSFGINMSLKEYILRLNRDDTALNLSINLPVPLYYFLDKAKVGMARVEKLIRLESLDQDLKELGFNVPPKYPESNGLPVDGIEWYNDQPECVEVVNRLYWRDFKQFGYPMIEV